MNAPVVERFVEFSPYTLEGGPTLGYTVRDVRDGTVYPIELPPEPAWYRRHTSRDIPMSHVGVMQGTYLGIYIKPVRAFWNYLPSLNCRFCTTGANVGCREAANKSVDDVVETCHAARDGSGVTFVHLNGGFHGSRGLRAAEPYVRAVKERVGALVGVQLTPERDFSGYDRLIQAGVDHFSFCFSCSIPSGSRGSARARRACSDSSSFSTRWTTAPRRCRGAPSRERSSQASSRSKKPLKPSSGLPRSAHFQPCACSVRPSARTWKSGRRRSTTTCVACSPPCTTPAGGI